MSIQHLVVIEGSIVDMSRIKKLAFGSDDDTEADFSMDLFMPPPPELFFGDMSSARLAVEATTLPDRHFISRGTHWPFNVYLDDKDKAWIENNTEDTRIVSGAEATRFLIDRRPQALDLGQKLLLANKLFSKSPNVWQWRDHHHGLDTPYDHYCDEWSSQLMRFEFSTEDEPQYKVLSIIKDFCKRSVMPSIEISWEYRNDDYDDGDEDGEWRFL